MGQILLPRDTYAVMPGTLIVDDSPEVRSVIRAFLQIKVGMSVCGEAGNGVEAIEKAKELKPDLILLDLVMPLMNGVEAASVLKRLLPQSRIVLFSMYDEALGKALASAVGVDVVLPKVNGLTGLEESLQALNRREPFQHPAVN
jgi:DNA-binding NarL/FixJ family response regulator